MPQILIVTEPPEEAATTVVYRERISSSDLESNHDADRLEHDNVLPLSAAPRAAAE